MQRYLTDSLVYKIYEYIIYTYIHVHDTIYTGLQTEATKDTSTSLSCACVFFSKCASGPCNSMHGRRGCQ